jgi:hypothetical protein
VKEGIYKNTINLAVVSSKLRKNLGTWRNLVARIDESLN